MSNLITKRIDKQGRLTLPLSIRKQLNIFPSDELELFIKDEQYLCVKLKRNSCRICGTAIPMEQLVCSKCLSKLKDKI